MGGWISNLVILAAFLLPALSWLIQKLQEQYAIKKERDRQRQREEEMLRRGQTADAGAQRTDTDTDTDDARSAEQLRELAARRKAQLEALRQRQRQTQSQGPAEATAADRTDSSSTAREQRDAAQSRTQQMGPVARSGGATPPPIRRGPGGATAPPQTAGPGAVRLPSGVVIDPATGRHRSQSSAPSRTPAKRRSSTTRPSRQQQGATSRQRQPQPGAAPATQRQRTQPLSPNAISDAESPIISGGDVSKRPRRHTAAPDVRGLFLNHDTGRPRPPAQLAAVIAAAEVLGRPKCDRPFDDVGPSGA